MTPLWRKAYDAIERPLAAGSEAWIQSETFMDLATHSLRIQRRMLQEAHQATERWLHLWGWVSRGDVLRLSNQVASLERQVRQLRQEAEQRDRPLLNGHQPQPRTRSRPARRESDGRRAG
jgi:hypothetical protein